MSIKRGQRVKVIDKGSSFYTETGTVHSVTVLDETALVALGIDWPDGEPKIWYEVKFKPDVGLVTFHRSAIEPVKRRWLPIWRGRRNLR